MGKRDENGKRLKWVGWEKRMVKDRKAQRLFPSKRSYKLGAALNGRGSTQ